MEPYRNQRVGTAGRGAGVDLLEFVEGKVIRKDSFWKIVA
jgi:hypothetical protein